MVVDAFGRLCTSRATPLVASTISISPFVSLADFFLERKTVKILSYPYRKTSTPVSHQLFSTLVTHSACPAPQLGHRTAFLGLNFDKSLQGIDHSVRFEISLGSCPNSAARNTCKRASFATMSTGVSAAVTTAVESFVKGKILPNGLAVLTLDRPRALNAMNLEMDIEYRRLLDAWAADSAVKAVLVEGSTARAFSSGMDVKGVAALVKDDPHTQIVPQVFTAEYSLIQSIARYSKPYISLMDGVTMGFGIGLSGHGRYRVITERTLLAMPENAIGLFPDVGFAKIAAQSPGRGSVGAYLALTGSRISTPADAFFAGIPSHFVPSDSLPALKEALAQAQFGAEAHGDVERVLNEFAKPPPGTSALEELLPSIERVFAAGTSVAEILAKLKEEESSPDTKVAEWAREVIKGMSKGAPFSLALTQLYFSSAANAVHSGSDPTLLEIEGVMSCEYRLALRMSTRPDFVEGVRAVLVDKDQKPKWSPATLDDVDMEEVKACFAPVESELRF